MPSSNRPAEAWSIATAWRASTAGARIASHSTRWPIFNVEVRAASHMAEAMASYIGLSSASGGARWSMRAMPGIPPLRRAARGRPALPSSSASAEGTERTRSPRHHTEPRGRRVSPEEPPYDGAMAFHHVAIAARDLEATHHFYSEAMGFELVNVDVIPFLENGWARHLFYDTGNGEMLAIWDLHDASLPDFDAGISSGLGLPRFVNHIAFGSSS